MSMDATVVRGWEFHFERLIEDIGVCFRRCDLRRRASAYVRGLLGPVQRKNGWQLAEYAGHATPHGFQRLLGRASWDADEVRDVLMRYAREHLLTEGDHRTGSATPPIGHRLAATQQRRAITGVVRWATTSSSRRQTVPLPSQSPKPQCATVVLEQSA